MEVAAPGEVEEPAPKAKVQTRLDGQGGVAGQQRPQGSTDCAGPRQGQDMTGADEAAVAMRTALAKARLVHYRNTPAGLCQVVSARRPDDPAADHDDAPGRPAHVLIPTRKGSLGSRIKVASAQR